MNVFSILTMMLSTLRHRPAVTFAVACGVATATAVITGALLVGDSMRGSLRALTIERLGKIETIIAPGSFFPIDAVMIRRDDESAGAIESAIIFFPGGGVETSGGQRDGEKRLRRIGGVQIVGVDESFWELDLAGIRPETLPGSDSVLLNGTAARDLNVVVGDEVTLRLPVEAAVPADSPLGRRELRSEGLPRMKVAAIVPDRGLGRFSLSANQAAAATVFADRSTIAQTLDRDGQANVILLDQQVPGDAVSLNLRALGWNLKRVTTGDSVDYVSLTSDSLMLPEAAVERIAESLGPTNVTPVMSYLINAMHRADAEDSMEVLYSIVASVESHGSLVLSYDMADAGAGGRSVVPVVMNDWTAKRLNASIGSVIEMAYYEPEVQAGNEVEKTFLAAVTSIVPLTEPSSPYRRGRDAVFEDPTTPYNDPDLTPSVPGVTDQDSISDWDLPFELTRKIQPADDDYWNNHRLTPKVFIPLAEGRRLFGSRFGQTTGLRIDPSVGDLDSITRRIVHAIGPVRGDLGWIPQSIQSQQLAASGGTTPFDGLFLALSMFVIVSAVMLIALLLRLGVLTRLRELGTLLTVGWRPGRVLRLVMGETAMIGCIGALLGVVGGMGYAAAVLEGLRSWWVGAVTVPFLEFHWTWRSIAVGATVGWSVCMVTAFAALRFLSRMDPAAVIGGRRASTRLVSSQQDGHMAGIGQRHGGKLSGVIVGLAIAIAVLGGRGGGPAAAGAFLGGGMLLLAAALLWIYGRLQSRQMASMSLLGMAVAAARRNPTRSTLTIGLMATASFLILSLAAFRISPTVEGTGGFDLMATSAQPLYEDLRDPSVQRQLMGRDASLLDEVNVVTWRMRAGDDASCNNLYQAKRPTVLGVLPDSNGEWPSKFALAATQGQDASDSWKMLTNQAGGSKEDPIPMIVDQNTAMWSLQMTKGIGEVRGFEYEPGKTTYFQVVGLLSNSILQGRLLIGERNFTRIFPHQSGYRFFLFAGDDSSLEDSRVLSESLESRLGDAAIDVRKSDDVLAGMLEVQNTYLRTFQSLGALGLLLGTVGLAVAQLRGVLQRRGELAVLRAVGFTRKRLATLVACEQAFLLFAGVCCGIFVAVLSVLPVSWTTGSPVPVGQPLLMLAGILIFGWMAGLITVVKVLRMPLIESLRAEDAAIEV